MSQMKLWRLTVGQIDAYGVAETEEDMEQRKADVDPSFSYLPVRFEEVQIPGYKIMIVPDDEQGDEDKPKRRGGRQAAQ